MQLYYPVDEAVRNKGKLTLVDPKYIKYFSNILMDIKHIMEGLDSVNNEDIPDKDIIMERLDRRMKEKENNDIKIIVTMIEDNIKLLHLTRATLLKVLWELIIRVINATVGNKSLPPCVPPRHTHRSK